MTDETKGRVLGVISVKGGVGKTTTVANLGAVLSSEFGIRCVVVDANLTVPNLGIHLNIDDLNMGDPEVALQDILADATRSISEAVYVHDCGLHVVASSISGGDVDISSLKTRMRSLAYEYEMLIMDSPPGIGEEIKTVIDACDELVIISSLELPTVSATLKAIKLADSLGTRVRGIVLNRVKGSKFELSIRDVESTLETPILAIIPEDLKVHEALSKNMPVAIYAPNSPSGKAFRRLAAILIWHKPPKKGFSQQKGFFSRVADFVFGVFKK